MKNEINEKIKETLFDEKSLFLSSSFNYFCNNYKSTELAKEDKEEENKNSEKIEIKKEPIIEEIDTTVPKNNPEENNNLEQNDGNTILKEINQNTICHKLILKGSDIDITEKVYFKCS